MVIRCQINVISEDRVVFQLPYGIVTLMMHCMTKSNDGDDGWNVVEPKHISLYVSTSR